MPLESNSSALTATQQRCYHVDGFVRLPGLFTPTECDEFVGLMTAQKAAQQHGDHADDGNNRELGMATDPRLHGPLRACMKLDGWGDTVHTPTNLIAISARTFAARSRRDEPFARSRILRRPGRLLDS